MNNADKIRARIGRLRAKLEAGREVTSDGNPYMRCTSCHIRDPELSIREGKHFANCKIADIEGRIAQWEEALKEIT
jgi:C4-type Zn-finger protein